MELALQFLAIPGILLQLNFQLEKVEFASLFPPIPNAALTEIKNFPFSIFFKPPGLNSFPSLTIFAIPKCHIYLQIKLVFYSTHSFPQA